MSALNIMTTDSFSRQIVGDRSLFTMQQNCCQIDGGWDKPSTKDVNNPVEINSSYQIVRRLDNAIYILKIYESKTLSALPDNGFPD